MPTPVFETDEILWYANGKWGEAGYAIPNPAGKTYTVNLEIFQLHQLVGRTMFELTHREDAKFYSPPHKQFWFDLHQLLTVARKRLADNTRAPNDTNGLVATHATPAAQAFLVYPIPYFGERIRQPDIRQFAQIGLLLLSEMMQHNDNERATYVTPQFAGVMGKYLQEILAKMGMKYFGYSREDAYKPDFALKDADFQTYDPAKVMTSVEMTEERPPLQWWPTENDLSGIRSLPITEALLMARRWPATELLGQKPLAPSSGGVPAAATPAATAFAPPPGQSP